MTQEKKIFVNNIFAKEIIVFLVSAKDVNLFGYLNRTILIKDGANSIKLFHFTTKKGKD